jgi:hypothetical protein
VTPRGGHAVRLAFAEPCPYDFFKAAAANYSLGSSTVAPASAEFDARLWR